MRPCLPPRCSVSRRLTRSTTLKKRPREPLRISARAMAIARCDLPVPVPPMRTALRWSATKAPVARDRRVGEVEVVDVLGQRQLGDGELVFDRTGLLLGDLRREQVTDDPWRLVLALDGGGHDLVVGAAHPIELQRSHQVQNLGSFHQLALLRLS